MIDRSGKRARWSIAMGVSCLFTIQVGSSVSFCMAGNPVARTTNDRDADLVAAMVREEMLDIASDLCDTKLRNSDPRSDQFARWTIHQSTILVERRLSADDFTDASIKDASRPITDLLGKYPDHPRALFLKGAIFDVEAAAARHDVVVAAVQPSGGPREQRALRRITSLTQNALEFSELVDANRRSRESSRAHPSEIADLIRLEQEIRVMLVSMQLLQTELFPAGSRDHIATATSAASAAEQAIASLPPNCPARNEIERLRVQAILRSGDHRRARIEIDALANLDRSSPIIMALETQIDLANGKEEVVRDRLHQFYGTSPSQAPKTVDLDLARLNYLVATGSTEVGSWLDSIGQRNGAYARRRAESISLQGLRSDTSRKSVDPSLVAAQGRDWLRRGEPQRAAELLSAAAFAEIDHEEALGYAREAAAAFVIIKRSNKAADFLAKISIAKREGTSAAELQLQAAFLFATGESPVESLDRVSTLVAQSLRDTIEYWPNSEATAKAKTWLIKILESQDRLVEAAEIAMPHEILPDNRTTDQRRERYRLWASAIHASPTESRSEVVDRMIKSYEPLLNDPHAAHEFSKTAVLLVDREQLAVLTDLQTDVADPHHEFTEALRQFRQNRSIASTLQPPPEILAKDTTWRLMQDAREDSSRRKATAQLLNSWNVASADSLDHVLRMIWLNDMPAAMAMLRQIINQSETSSANMRLAIELLADTDGAEPKSEAVKLCDELASGSTKGSDQWHFAKLKAIELLTDLNQKEEAVRRAKYILLTSPPGTDAISQRYEQLAQ